jgi:MFS family permease
MRQPATPDAISSTAEAEMSRNMRILPWWWVTRFIWLGEAVWVIYLVEERGLSFGQVLAFEAAFGTTILLAEVPTGIVADRYSRKLSLILASLITAVGMLTFGLATGIPLLLFSYIAFGVGEAFSSGADSAVLFETLKTLKRDDEFSRRVGFFNGMLTAMIAASTVVGATLVTWFPLNTPFIISAALSVPALGLALALREPPRLDERSSFLGTGRLALARVRRTRSMWSLMVVYVTGGVTISMMGVTLPLILFTTHDLPIWAIGLFVASQLLVSSAGSLVAAPLVRRFGLPLTVSAMALGGPLSLLAGASGVVWLMPVFMLPSITYNVLFIHLVDFLSRRSPDSQRATTVSLASMAAQVGFIGVAFTFGRVADARGIETALVIGAIAFTSVAAIALSIWLRSGDTSVEPRVRPGEAGAADTGDLEDREGTPVEVAR